MRRKSTIPKPQLAFCLENTHTITYVVGDSYACISCGMSFRSESRDPRFYRTTENLKGRTFRRLNVIEFSGYERSNAGNLAYWTCECIEGNTIKVAGRDLKSKKVQSCGCLAIQTVIQRSTTHGKSHTTEYNIWGNMIKRCTNPRDRAYPDYGGRGITVCDRWKHDFSAFYDDLGPRPSSSHMLERIDNNGPYDAQNCKWSTRIEQNRNKRNNVMITYNGMTLCIQAWADKLGINPRTLAKRLRNGWDPIRALTHPIRIDKDGNPRRQAKILTHNGITQSADAWGKALNIHTKTILARLRLGWSIEKTLTTPLRNSSIYTI